MKQYYKVITNHALSRYEFHTGTDKKEVQQGKSLNSAVKFNSVEAGEVMKGWFNQIQMYNLTPVN